MARPSQQMTRPLRHGACRSAAPEDAEDTEDAAQPPDGGWGWVVGAGVFLIALVVPMLSSSFGILFSRQLLEWRASSTTVGLLFNTFLVVWRLVGVVLGTLTREFGFRRVAVTGTLLTATCLTLSAFATSPAHLFVTFSLGCGLGNGLSCVGYLILAHYFKRRRGLANALLVAGAGLGHFVSPLVIRVLQEEYGLRGATIILGGITLHAVLGASLFQPVDWHCKKPEQKGAVEEPEAVFSLLSSHTEAEDVREAAVKVPDCSMEGGSDPGSDSEASAPNLVSQTLPKAVLDWEDEPRYVRPVIPLIGTESVPGGGAAWRVSDRRRPSALFRTVSHVMQCVVSDMQTLRQPTCLIIALGSTLVINAEANFLVMVPFAIQAAGHSLQTAAWCVAIAGVCNLFTRMCVSALSDMAWFNMRRCYMAGIALMAASVVVFTLQTGVTWRAGVMGVWGCSAGMFSGLNNLLMTRVVGLRRLTSVYGARNLLGALGFFFVGPVVGVIRDASDSYAVSMWMLASLMSLSFLLWLLMPAAQAYERRQATRERSGIGA
ncbi:Monocarboxylate transporter 5 [Chionoecetes opilio]|uniref:Monocarboxylate transporter 5 n=1 Tax=Chionoecetes opilio TaxID=41210 RepID=A0A8J5CQM1_CHIOP|nr:Monocarboxylate transporter 5 [Chionoecetes opilio]